MADYSRVHNFTAKDALASGDPSKLIKGTEVDAELNAAATAIATKADDTDTVHITGSETVSGAKAFSATLSMSGAALNYAASADVASAATTDIGAVASNNVRITGTTTITSLGTASAGITRKVRFADALTLTHNGTSLILKGAANITTAANDTAEFLSLGSGNWLCLSYNPAGAFAAAATQAQMETATSNAVFATPGRLHNHPGVPKAWAKWAADVTLNASYNVSSVTDNGTGDWTVNFSNSFSTAHYGFTFGFEYTSGGVCAAQMSLYNSSAATNMARVIAIDTGDLATERDGSSMCAMFLGDQ